MYEIVWNLILVLFRIYNFDKIVSKTIRVKHYKYTLVSAYFLYNVYIFCFM